MEELCLQCDYYDVEETIVKTFFPHATTDPSTLTPLPVIDIPEPVTTLDFPFTIGELKVALIQGEPISAPGHDTITWQDLRNLPQQGYEVLLSIINRSWDSG